MTALMAGAGIAGMSLPAFGPDPPHPVPWWALAVLFALTEITVLAVPIRREQVTLSLSEIPLALGLLLAAPWEVITAAAAGSAAVFVLHRRQPPPKAAFNTSLVMFAASVAVVVQHVLGPSWWAVVAACAVSGMAAVSVLVLVMTWFGELSGVGGLARQAAMSGLMSAVSAVLGVAAAAMIVDAPRLIPIAVTGLVVLGGYRLFAQLSDRHAGLQRLYRLSAVLTEVTATDDVAQHCVRQCADLLQVARVDLDLEDKGTGETRRWTHGTLPAARDDGHRLRVRVVVDPSYAGWLTAAHRVYGRRGFGEEDRRLLETVSNQVAVALRNGRLIARLEQEARHDELTGLANRVYFRQWLDALDGALDRGGSCAVILIDLDGFKAVNDTLGHHAGDELLRQVAARLGAAGGDRIRIARLGGDEFAGLAVPCSGPDDAQALGRQLHACFDEPFMLSGQVRRLGASIGISVGPGHGATGDALLRAADAVMYEVKAAGGGVRVVPGARPQIVTQRTS